MNDSMSMLIIFKDLIYKMTEIPTFYELKNWSDWLSENSLDFASGD